MYAHTYIRYILFMQRRLSHESLVFFRIQTSPLGVPTRKIKFVCFRWATKDRLYSRNRQGREIFLSAPFFIAPSSMVPP